MKAWVQYNVDTGEIIGWAVGHEETPGPDFIQSPDLIIKTPSTHYVKAGVLTQYSDLDLMRKNGMPQGYTWDIQSCQPIDVRTEQQRTTDTLEAVLVSRSKSYPPLVDLADALYWQAQGDDSKMNSYLAACKKVKEDLPKPSLD